MGSVILFLNKGMCGCQSIKGWAVWGSYYSCHQHHFPFYSGDSIVILLGGNHSFQAVFPTRWFTYCRVLSPCHTAHSWLRDTGLPYQTNTSPDHRDLFRDGHVTSEPVRLNIGILAGTDEKGVLTVFFFQAGSEPDQSLIMKPTWKPGEGRDGPNRSWGQNLSP